MPLRVEDSSSAGLCNFVKEIGFTPTFRRRFTLTTGNQIAFQHAVEYKIKCAKSHAAQLLFDRAVKLGRRWLFRQITQHDQNPFFGWA